MAAVEALLDRGRKAAPDSPALAVIRADALAAMGHPEAASELLAKAVVINKTDPDLWLAHATMLVEPRAPGPRLMALDQAMEPRAAGDQANLRILRARVLTAQGHGSEAREGLVRDLERVRTDQRPLLWMALGEPLLRPERPGRCPQGPEGMGEPPARRPPAPPLRAGGVAGRHLPRGRGRRPGMRRGAEGAGPAPLPHGRSGRLPAPRAPRRRRRRPTPARPGSRRPRG